MGDQNRAFGVVMAVGLGALSLLRYLWAGTIPWWLIGIAVAFLVVGLLVPSWLSPVHRWWMKLAGVLGFINSRILLTIVFAFLITPMALLMRLIGKRPISLGISATAVTYWRTREPEEFRPERLERQF